MGVRGGCSVQGRGCIVRVEGLRFRAWSVGYRTPVLQGVLEGVLQGVLQGGGVAATAVVLADAVRFWGARSGGLVCWVYC